jgi:ribonuclease R
MRKRDDSGRRGGHRSGVRPGTGTGTHAGRRDGIPRQYRVAIPERQDILDFLREAGRPRTLEHILAHFRITSDEVREALEKRLAAMVRDGQILPNRRDGYGLMEKLDLVTGRVVGHPDGYGFLVPDDGVGTDLFLPAHEMRTVLHGDRVAARVTGTDSRGRREGAVVEVLERANTRVVGRLKRHGRVGFVTPDNRRINQDVLVPSEDLLQARDGQFVVAEIVAQPTRHAQPVGRVVEVLGDHAAPGMATDIAIRACGIPYQWNDDVLREAAQLDPEAPLPLRGRLDLRHVPLVTIDGEDARDFDDAVYAEPAGRGWRLVVAIADVSHYVRPGTALDAAARERGTSVYFPDRVVPMLPEVLSNDLCSLRPDVDRLCMVCEMDVGPDGRVRGAKFADAVMCSAARLTYTEMAALVVDRDPALRAKRAKLVPHLDHLYALFRLMNRKRAETGVLDFDTTETRIHFDEHGRISAIRPLVRNDAHRLIEEFMLAANVATASALEKAGIPALYRNHAGPKAEKLEALREFLGELGLDLPGGDSPRTKDYAKLCNAVTGREDARLIKTLMLRSLPLAVYSAENIGHFGLDFTAYAHFTSPIRRYPDLMVHRAIRAMIRRRVDDVPDENDLHALAEHCSMTERRADEATRDAVQRLKCGYMEQHLGDEFPGVITGVAPFGIFVELDDLFVEGMVHVTSLPADYYHHDAIRHQLVGERRGLKFRLAGRVRVKVVRVDADEKKMDFEVVAGGESGRRGGTRAGGTDKGGQGHARARRSGRRRR